MDFARNILSRWRNDYNFKTFLSAGGSAAITVLFALYNAYLGAQFGSLWNGSIAVYYLILTLIRTLLILSEHRIYRKKTADPETLRKRIFSLSAGTLFLLNLAMVVPISLMVVLKKPVVMGMSPAIVLAAYTVYKVTIAAVHFHRRRKSSNVFVRLLRTINLIDALLSIISLQNALISVKGGGPTMLIVSAATSAVLLLHMLVLSVVATVRGARDLKEGSRAEH